MIAQKVSTVFPIILLLALAPGCRSEPATPAPAASPDFTIIESAEATREDLGLIGAASATPFKATRMQEPTPTEVAGLPPSPMSAATPLPELELATPTATATPLAPAATPAPPTQAPPTAASSATPTQTSTTASCQTEWFFANPAAECPEGPALNSYAAGQRFEHGQMIWVEGTDTFYILFEAGRHPSDSRQVYRTLSPLTLKPGASPDNRIGESPPAGYYEPVSGFGLIWRNEVEGLDADVRAALGWATVPEFGFNTDLQCAQQQTYSSRTCYLRNSDGSVLGLGWSALVGSVWWTIL